MNNYLHRHRGGFTLVEIMIVVAIIAICAAIAVPNYMRGRKRAQATRVLDELRNLDSAMDQWASEHNKQSGDVALFSDLAPYLKQNTTLNIRAADLFGQPYGPYTVDVGPRVSEFTFAALRDVAPSEFWSPYR